MRSSISFHEEETYKVSIMRLTRDSTKEIKYPKQITTSRGPQNSESQPANVNNPFKWSLHIRTGPLNFLKQGFWFLTETGFHWAGRDKLKREQLQEISIRKVNGLCFQRMRLGLRPGFRKATDTPHREAEQHSQLVSQKPS